MVVSYVLSEDPVVLREQRKTNLAKADLVDLCYSCFGGDLTLRVDGADFSIVTGGGVQILDFAVEFFTVGQSVAAGKSGRIEFAGMADEIYVTPSGESVTIGSNYTEDVAQVTRQQFVRGGRTFLTEVLTDLVARYPELRSNRGIKQAGAWVGMTI
ncbi:hypothetical protein ACFU2J_04555 [Streptomyces sp. NPDC057387]|uniref:hypothetical protein n=1 Tax=Streptomyces sp. NPDC057387 TaxID=3346115 RepID=UPI00363CB5B4